MELSWFEIATSLALGIGLAAASGLRVFVPLLIAGLVLRFNLWSVPGDIALQNSWLASNTALICFGVATVAEVIAYKLPFLDHFLDVIGAPVAIAAGALLASTFLTGIDEPLVKYGLGIIAGAGAAGAVHAGSAVTRLASTKTTGGLGNPIVSLAELGASLFASIFAFIAPFLILMLLIVFLLVAFFLVKKLLRKQSQKSTNLS
jgi:hypothetical protein